MGLLVMASSCVHNPPNGHIPVGPGNAKKSDVVGTGLEAAGKQLDAHQEQEVADAAETHVLLLTFAGL